MTLLQLALLGAGVASALVLQPQPCVVIVPGFLYGASNYEGMCRRMRERGVAAMVAPIAAWHWIPVLGGRSVRPILERIDFAVDFAATSDCLDDDITMPWPPYSVADLLLDFKDTPGGVLRAGGTSDPEQFPCIEPRGVFFRDAQKSTRPFAPPNAQHERRKVALVGYTHTHTHTHILTYINAYTHRDNMYNIYTCIHIGRPCRPFSSGLDLPYLRIV